MRRYVFYLAVALLAFGIGALIKDILTSKPFRMGARLQAELMFTHLTERLMKL
jgi:hypothetical protein